MKTLVIVLLLFCFSFSAYSQPFKIGAGIVAGIYGQDIDESAGGEIDIAYQVSDPFRVRIAGGLYVSDFILPVPTSYEQPYYLSYLEADFLYYPIVTFVKPYVGAGTGYYNPDNTTQGGGRTVDGTAVAISDLEKGFGINFIAGVETVSSGIVSFNLEFRYLVLRSEFDVDFYNSVQTVSYKGVEANLDILSVKLGMIFNL